MKVICIALGLTLLLSCHSQSVPQTGDLAFKISGGGAFSKAITDATGSGEIQFDHVGIVWSRNDSLYVIEATSRGGVKVTPWEDFAASAPIVDGKTGIVIKRLTVPFPVNDAIDRALSHLGEQYDWYYLPDNGRMYCSELVYESYLDYEGRRLFSAKGMNFKDKEGNMPQFWTDLFAKLGRPVPQDSLGTNPNDMAAEPILRTVAVTVER